MGSWVLVALAAAVVLAAPVAWAALRFGALRGVIAGVGAGLFYEFLVVALMMAWNFKDYGVAIRQHDFGFGFGLLLAQGFLGLFWIPAQVLLLAVAAALRHRYGLASAPALPGPGASRIANVAFWLAVAALSGFDAIATGRTLAAGSSCDMALPVAFVLSAYAAAVLFVVSGLLAPRRDRMLIFSGLLIFGLVVSFGCMVLFGDPASRLPG